MFFLVGVPIIKLPLPSVNPINHSKKFISILDMWLGLALMYSEKSKFKLSASRVVSEEPFFHM